MKRESSGEAGPREQLKAVAPSRGEPGPRAKVIKPPRGVRGGRGRGRGYGGR